jgi:hypothetical protein
MALSDKDAGCANHEDLVKALVGETIVGVIQDHEGRWWLVGKSGYAFVFSPGNGAYWRENPEAVKGLIEKRKADLGKWTDEVKSLMRFSVEDHH